MRFLFPYLMLTFDCRFFMTSLEKSPQKSDSLIESLPLYKEKDRERKRDDILVCFMKLKDKEK
jgi:hypothetical protein